MMLVVAAALPTTAIAKQQHPTKVKYFCTKGNQEKIAKSQKKAHRLEARGFDCERLLQ
jgi:hypothetical protein